MSDALSWLAGFLGSDSYYQHAICLTNDPVMIALYVCGDMSIFLSYFVIGITLGLQRVWKMRPKPPAFMLYAVFIFMCGVSHASKTLTIFSGLYRLDIMIVAITASVSIVAAVYTVLAAIKGETRDVPS